MKKIRLLLAFIMLMLSIGVYAQVGYGTRFTKDGFTYSVIGSQTKTVEIVGCSLSGDIVFPAIVNSKGSEGLNEDYDWKVIRCGQFRFSSKEVSSVKVSEGIEYFATTCIDISQQNITKVELPSTISEIVQLYAESFCPSIEEFIISPDNPYYCCEDLVIYNKQKTSLSFYLPSNIKNDVKIFEIPSTVVTIETEAFHNNNILEKIIIPSSVKSIKAIYWGTSMKEFDVEESNTVYCDIDGVLFSKDGKILYNCPSKKDFGNDGVYVIPEGTETIKSQSFRFVANLKEVKFPSTTKKVEESAFVNCANIEVVYMPDNGEFAPSSFVNSTRMKKVNIGLREDFSAGYFTQCGTKIIVEVPDENPAYKNVDDILFTKNGETLVFCPREYGTLHPEKKDYTVPEGTKYIGDGAFEGGCQMSNITLASTVETLGRYSLASVKNVTFAEESSLRDLGVACMSNLGMRSIVLPNSVRRIRTNAFSNSKLLDITLNEGLDSIAIYSFTYTSIGQITIPASVTVLEYASLGVMSNLKRVVFKKNSQLEKINNLFYQTPNLEEVIFEEGSIANAIPEQLFINQRELKTVVLPETLTSIDARAFQGCTNLTNFTLREPSQLKKIGASAFQSCSSLTSFTVPSTVTTIGNAAFYDCNKLETIEIPAATQTISNTAFQLCTSLTEINVDKENPWLSSSDGILLNKAKTELKIFPAGKTRDHFALLPPSITKIGDYSFYFNKTVKNVCIPNKVEEIGIRSFSECDSLETITFLCDEMIPASKINTDGLNNSSFANTNLKNTTIYVRKDLLDDYLNEPFYADNFKAIKPSFVNAEETEEYIPVDDNTVDLLDVRSGVHSYIIPQTVSTNAYGENKTYNVGLVGDYSFQNAPSTMKEVITFDNVEYIGAKAFKQTNTTPSIENIIFVQKEPQTQLLSTYRFELMPEDLPSTYTDEQKMQYMEVAEGQHIYVRKSDNTACQTQWPKYASQIDYKIPGIKIGTKYGTFSREFDVDLLDYKAEDQEDSDVIINWDGSKNRAKVIAFTGFLEQVNPYDNYTYIRMRSINCETESEVSTKPGDGTYIPANTGVLLRAYTEDAKTPEGFYYRIGEDDGVNFHPLAENENVMVEVVVDKKLIQPKEGDYTNYIISGGQYHALGAAGTLAVHKSYMHVYEPEGSKGVKVVFGDDEDATGIEEINAALNESGNDVIYNLNGQRVNGNVKGIVIKNGKKIFVK